MIVALLRTVILYLIVVLSLRFMGKRQIGELEPSELVATILLSELAAIPMQDLGIPLLQGIIPILALLCIELLFSVGTLKSFKFRTLMCGKPSIVIHEGKILESQLRKNRLTLDELLAELRILNITDLSTIQYAILENNGKISTVLYPSHRPATTESLGQTAPETGGLPYVVINDGRIMQDNPRVQALKKEWIEAELKKHGLSNVRDVFLMLVDERNAVYFIAREGKTS